MNKKNISKDILEFGLQVNKSTDLNFVLEKIIEEKSLGLLSSNRATLYLLDDKKEKLIPRATLDPVFEAESLSEIIPVKSSLSGKVVNSKKGKIFNNASKFSDAYTIPGTSDDDDDEHLMILPIKIDNNVIGTINFYRDHNPYTEEELELGRIFSMYASVAIQNALMNDQLLKEIRDRKESEEKFRALYDNAPLSYQSLNEDGSFKDVNPAWLSTLGYERDEVIGKFYKDFLHPDYKPHFEKNFPAFKKRGYVHDVQFKIRHKKGHYLDISFEGCVGYNPDGSFKQTYCVFQDITESKRADEKIKQSEKRYRLLTDNALETIWTTDLQFNMTYVNNAITNFLGYVPEEFLGLSADLWTLPEGMIAIQDAAQKLVADFNDGIRSKQVFQVKQKKKDGQLIDVEIMASLLLNDKGEPIGFQGRSIDITDRKQAEEKLKESEEKYKNVIEHSSQMFYIHDDKHVLSYVSHKCFDLFGYTPEEMMIKWTTLVTDNPINEKGFKITETTLKTGKVLEPYILEIKRKDGQKRLVKVFESPLKDETGNVVGISGSLEDVTDIKKYEKELIEKNERLELFATIFKNLNECITVTDKDHKIFYVNKAFKQLYGYKEEEYLGKTVDFLRTDNDPELLKEIKKNTNNGGWSGEIVNRKKDGTVFPIELSTTRIFDKEKNIVARIGIVKDISERKKTEKELDEYKNHLEKLVSKRTEELEEKNKMLDSSVKVFVGREQTIIKLKRKIKELEAQLEAAK